MTCGYPECKCDRRKFKIIVHDKVSNTRTLLRCGGPTGCGGIIGWLDDEPNNKPKPEKIRPDLKDFSSREKELLR